jgi:protein-tyrosine-phosphatase
MLHHSHQKGVSMAVLPEIEKTIELLKNYFPVIPENRKILLQETSHYINGKIKNDKTAKLIFICTHNSRRSHISQMWAQAAAEYYELPMIECYSGGTEATAFNPRAVKAMRDAGFEIRKETEQENPTYSVSYSKDREPLKVFSKEFGSAHNPQKDFAAIMTCSDADENCPIVPGAEARFPIRYDDPKEFDGTEQEEEEYQERTQQIGTEMLYLMKLVKESM